MARVRRLGHATLATPDLERQVDYWTGVIGLQIIDRGKDHAFLATKLGQEAITLERDTTSHLKRISFQVDPEDDLHGDQGGESRPGGRVEEKWENRVHCAAGWLMFEKI